MDILSSQNKRISQLNDFLCEAADLLNNPRMDVVFISAITVSIKVAIKNTSPSIVYVRVMLSHLE